MVPLDRTRDVLTVVSRNSTDIGSEDVSLEWKASDSTTDIVLVSQAWHFDSHSTARSS
jgi:uncharacterized protein YheU (UPF0270 family)